MKWSDLNVSCKGKNEIQSNWTVGISSPIKNSIEVDRLTLTHDLLIRQSSSLTGDTGSLSNSLNFFDSAMYDVLLSSYKGCAVLRSCFRDVASKQSSYSELSAYISCLYFAKSIILLHGFWSSSSLIVTSTAPKGKCFVIDLFNKNYHKMDAVPSHKNLWELFINLLDANGINTLSMPLYNFIKNTNAQEISNGRNKIQYDYSYWIHDDLFKDQYECDSIISTYLPNRTIGYIDVKDNTSSPYRKLSYELLDYILTILNMIPANGMQYHANKFNNYLTKLELT